jgi:hypothetical protein
LYLRGTKIAWKKVPKYLPNSKNSVKNSLAILLLLCLAGCHDSEKKTEHVIEIELDGRVAMVDGLDTPIDELKIIYGNGGYGIIYPRELYIDGDSVPYSSDILNVHIEENSRIVVERGLKGYHMVMAYFVLVDQKGAKRFFVVITADSTGLIDVEYLERVYMNDPDYWQ